MNKYQEALDFLCDNSKLTQFNIGQSQWASETLQELVDKATPTEVVGLSLTHDGHVGNCPYCAKFVRVRGEKPNICECGQKLIWNKKESKDETNTIRNI